MSETFIVAPQLVVEVISPDSVTRDRVTKLDIYRALPSVHEYLMIDSRKIWVSVPRRGPANTWLDVTCSSLDDTLHLVSVELRLPLSELYRGIDFSKKRNKQR